LLLLLLLLFFFGPLAQSRRLEDIIIAIIIIIIIDCGDAELINDMYDSWMTMYDVPWMTFPSQTLHH